MTTVRDLLAESRRRLEAAGLDARDAALDAEVLARDSLGWDRARLLAHADESVPPGTAALFRTMVARRAAREPVSQILGHREFWGLDIEVTADVLTPRPESELLVEESLARLHGHARPWRIADVGTGSGCLAVALARERPSATVVAADLSAAALAVARRNARRHGVAARVRLVRASLLDGLRGPFDLIVSNPPYVRSADLPSLPPEVRDHEPPLALDGGPDGLDLVRALVAQAAPRLAAGGWLVFEIGAGQQAEAGALVAASGVLDVEGVRADLAGIARTIIARLRRVGGR